MVLQKVKILLKKSDDVVLFRCEDFGCVFKCRSQIESCGGFKCRSKCWMLRIRLTSLLPRFAKPFVFFFLRHGAPAVAGAFSDIRYHRSLLGLKVRSKKKCEPVSPPFLAAVRLLPGFSACFLVFFEQWVRTIMYNGIKK